MQKVCTADEMAAVDAAALKQTTMAKLVERAGNAVAGVALSMLGGAYGRRITVVAGQGYNGDDGRVAARLLARRGAKVTVVGVFDPPVSIGDCDLVIDAGFGTGFRGSYKSPVVPPRAMVLAVDIPSGLDVATGVAKGKVAKADVTVTFGALKPGLVLNDGPELSGRIVLAEIGLQIGNVQAHLLDDADLARVLPPRRQMGHKWDAPVYVVAGSSGMTGAAGLAAQGALRAGSGMVRLSIPGLPVGSVSVTEVVQRFLPVKDWALPLLDELGRCRALVIGPGLGTTPEVGAAVRRILAEAPIPIVLDADGLSVLGTVEEAALILGARRGPLVITPHDGEYARLIGAKPGTDRLDAARDLARRTRAVVLLKGSTTVVADPNGKVLLVTSGGTNLSSAGTGDVLSGIVGAFLARGVEPLSAAALAAHVHGQAARLGKAEGLVASDLPPLVADVISMSRVARHDQSLLAPPSRITPWIGNG